MRGISTTKPRFTRPEHRPAGYEWLPDAFARDVGFDNHAGRELVRSALAEGQIVALLRIPLGHRYEIPQRMWDKEPVARMVLPRFKDGWMQMGLNELTGPHVEGWIFVPRGALKNVLGSSSRDRRPKPLFSAAKLSSWYLEEYVPTCQRANRTPSREDDLAAAKNELGIDIPREAMRKLRRKHAPDDWHRPGRRKSGG